MKKCFGVFLVMLLAACGGKGPTAPPPPPPEPTNRPPVIGSIDVSPTFGVSQLTRFSWSASASDPDGDSLGYAWEVAGNAFTGPSGSAIFDGSGTATAHVVVSDGKGGTTQGEKSFVVGSMTGVWRGTMIGVDTQWSFQQTLNRVTGEWIVSGLGSGRLDEAGTNVINDRGEITLRAKLGPFSDVNIHGQMDTSGRRINATLHGSGFNGEPLTLIKQ